MTRQYPCPVPGCGMMRLHWHAVCPSCFRRLPVDLANDIVKTRKARAKVRQAQAGIVARDWLAAHPPGSAASSLR